MFRTFVAAAFIAIAPTAVLANSCPALMAEVDAALPTATISEEDKAKVMELRAKGEELHESGDHAGSEAALNEAKEILGI